MKRMRLAIFGVILLVAESARTEIIYSNDFSGTGGDIAGAAAVGSNLAHTVALAEMDGAGHLVPNTFVFGAGLRVKLADQPLNTAKAYSTYRLSCSVSAPTNTSWIGVGFCGAQDVLNKEGGPWVQVSSTSLRLRGGKGVAGTEIWETGTHAPGDLLDIEMTWYTNDTADLVINGVTLLESVALEHNDGAGGTVPPIQYLVLQLAAQPTDGSAYIGGVEVEGLYGPIIPPYVGITYSNDFAGASGGDVAAAAQEGADLAHTGPLVGLDGAGHLVPTSSVAWASLRVELNDTNLAGLPSVEGLRLSATFKSPANNWIGAGFMEVDGDSLVKTNYNTGPWLLVSGNSFRVKGGAGAVTGTDVWYQNQYAVGSTNTLVLTYYTDQTVDVALNGSSLTNGLALAHVDDAGLTNAPVVKYLCLQFFNQPTDGSVFFEDVSVEVLGPAANTGYAAFTDQYGITGAPQSGPMEDYDGDGQLNINEYAFGGDPLDPADTGVLPEFSYGSNNMVRFANVIVSDPDADVSYSVESTTNLVSGVWGDPGWTAVNTNASPLSGYSEMEHIIDGSSLNELFIRLRVIQP